MMYVLAFALLLACVSAGTVESDRNNRDLRVALDKMQSEAPHMAMIFEDAINVDTKCASCSFAVRWLEAQLDVRAVFYLQEVRQTLETVFCAEDRIWNPICVVIARWGEYRVLNWLAYNQVLPDEVCHNLLNCYTDYKTHYGAEKKDYLKARLTSLLNADESTLERFDYKASGTKLSGSVTVGGPYNNVKVGVEHELGHEEGYGHKEEGYAHKEEGYEHKEEGQVYYGTDYNCKVCRNIVDFLQAQVAIGILDASEPTQDLIVDACNNLSDDRDKRISHLCNSFANLVEWELYSALLHHFPGEYGICESIGSCGYYGEVPHKAVYAGEEGEEGHVKNVLERQH